VELVAANPTSLLRGDRQTLPACVPIVTYTTFISTERALALLVTRQSDDPETGESFGKVYVRNVV